MKVDIDKIAQEADVIICGYAVTKTPEGFYQIINLNEPDSAVMAAKDGELLETNTNEIETQIAIKYMLSSLKYMED